MQRIQLGQYIRQYGPDIHLHKQGTPTMGGVVFLFVLLSYWLLQPHASPQLTFVLSASLLFGLIGLADDLLKFAQRDSEGLKVSHKFLLQALGALLLFKMLPGTWQHMLLIPGQTLSFNLEGWVLLAWIFLVFSGTTHAFNLTDGLDGLAGGVGFVALLSLILVAGWQGQYDLVWLSTLMCAAMLAFLCFNLYPARIFMGDTGSFALGAFVAAVAFSLGLELYLIFFALVPVLEAVSVALQVAWFKLTRRRIFKIAPFHHHFEAARGVDYGFWLPNVEWQESRITVSFWIVAALGALFGLGLYLIQSPLPI